MTICAGRLCVFAVSLKGVKTKEQICQNRTGISAHHCAAMCSYVGIIQIRLTVEGHLPLSLLRKLPSV